METSLIFVKLLCAHFFADFILQTDGINSGKRRSGIHGIGFLFLHSVIHACVAYLFVADWSCWLIPMVVLISHFLIDMIKIRYQKDSLKVFIADQLVHILVIGLLVLFVYGEVADFYFMVPPISVNAWLIGMGYILMLKPSSILLSLFLEKWISVSPNTQSLPNAGQWIGYIERVLIFTFVIIGSIEGVGFLLAAKSVFRFGELNKASEIRTTEYVLIGTLASFTIAILIGIIISNLLISQ